ncbi:MFS general substrate transporter, partial [Penicillium malachiteum]|uniref:MFS general substrate transporter n=1 Tax=Penicillium malachiteum TaxID=1324776 RepID=UPI00254799C4
ESDFLSSMTDKDRKLDLQNNVEAVESQKPTLEHIDNDPVYSYKDQRKIIHRVDIRLILMLGFMHCVCLIDRGNPGSAAVAGMEKELHLIGNRYNKIAVSFFPPYICLQIFGPILVRKIGPVKYLSGVCFVWGAVMLSGGFVKEWPHVSLPYLDLVHSNGLQGLSAWRWILIIQGLITCAIATVGWFILVDFPDRIKSNKRNFLSNDEFSTHFFSGVAPRMVGAFLTTMGCNANIPAAMAYQENNIRGQWKRAFASAVLVGLGASGGLTGSLIFRTQDAPGYHPGILTCVGLSVLIIILVMLLSIRFYILNKKVDRGELVIGNLPGFKYTY